MPNHWRPAGPAQPRNLVGRATGAFITVSTWETGAAGRFHHAMS